MLDAHWFSLSSTFSQWPDIKYRENQYYPIFHAQLAYIYIFGILIT